MCGTQLSFCTAPNIREPWSLAELFILCWYRKVKSSRSWETAERFNRFDHLKHLWEHVLVPLPVLAFIKNSCTKASEIIATITTYHSLPRGQWPFYLSSITARRNGKNPLLPESFTLVPEGRWVFFFFSVFSISSTVQGYFQTDRKEESLSLPDDKPKVYGGPIKLAWQWWPTEAQALVHAFEERRNSERHRMSVSPGNGLCNYSIFSAIFAHASCITGRINHGSLHHNYSFLLTCE